MSDAQRIVPTVVLADDHPIVRYAIRLMLESNRLAKVVGEASSPMELLQVLADTPCDIVMTDLSMPDEQSRDGLYLIERILRTYPDKPIVVVTALRNAGVLSTLLHKGVKGLIEKEGEVTELGMALRSVSHGRRYVSASLRALLASREVHGEQEGAAKLTEAEMEVLRLFAYEGLTSQQISERLNRSRKTVSRHKRSAQAKLGLSTNQELIEYCRSVDLGK
ncbi:response regulator transcription factor [Dyella choica]|uniref:Response regulator transcription factor n=1 Tax=Dyella choica TaxID=1927959 RepID=A0A3S0RK42_9GAMM|nr:response regulator transcription factor [Dyella choica]RUL74563.1 response regulator transcription factor [Dyella choica]